MKVLKKKKKVSVTKKRPSKTSKSGLVFYMLSLKRIILPLVIIVLVLVGISYFLPKEVNCANSISCIKDLTGEYNKKSEEGVFLGKRVIVPGEVQENIFAQTILGETASADKHIYVDLSTQRLYAFSGNTLIYDFPVSTGKWFPTPTGNFNIWVKLRYTKMEGGNQAIGTYYYLPNVPYTMFYHGSGVDKGQGFSLHGAYWHNNFGHPMSHGCINMRIEDAGKIYAWVDPPTKSNITYATKDTPGTAITVYGSTPAE